MRRRLCSRVWAPADPIFADWLCMPAAMQLLDRIHVTVLVRVSKRVLKPVGVAHAHHAG